MYRSLMAEIADARPLEANLRLYSWHQLFAGLYFWLPTSFLFFLERLSLGASLRLVAVYFLAVVVLEVPSGWASDRLGRVPTLRAGALVWIAAFLVFVLGGDSVLILAAGQILIAAGFAALSGTTAAFHYDTLEALQRADQFERREAAIARNALLGTTAAVLAGGALGFVDLRLPFTAALAAACAQFIVTIRMTDPSPAPPGTTGNDETAPRLVDVVRNLKRPSLAWIFVFMIAQQPLEGLALDQIPPWLAIATGNALDDSGTAPLFSGALIAVISLVGAAAAGASHRLREAMGLRPALVLLASIEATILVGMAVTVSPWLLPLLTLRSTQAAAGTVLVSSATAPVLHRNHRATFLSIGSLAGRLTYGIALLAMGFITDFDTVLQVSAAIGVGSVGLLIVAHFLLAAETLDPADKRDLRTT